ncbi:hypothetical protein CHELA20_11112 [Hyphomicrobiales bacterium]|nr:hypothetical protein CHELA20_11112 [Hyphomicrobiales bacterium]
MHAGGKRDLLDKPSDLPIRQASGANVLARAGHAAEERGHARSLLGLAKFPTL